MRVTTSPLNIVQQKSPGPDTQTLGKGRAKARPFFFGIYKGKRMEAAFLLAQLVTTGSLACWLTVGVRDNLLHPSVNETYTAQVMVMARLRDEYPAEYQQVAYRAVTDRRMQKRAFKSIVVAEFVAAILLWTGALALLGAFAGAVSADAARTLAVYGATAFVAIWSSFLVVGNHFSYWLGHEGAQNTHFQMTLWGLGTIILMAQG